MSYHPRNKHNSLYNILRTAGLVVGVFLIGVLIFSILRPIVMSTATSFWQAENFLANTLSSVTSILRFKKDLLAENKALKQELASLEIERLTYRGFEEREAELRTLLGGAGEVGGLVSAVLARPPQVPYDTIIIDTGSSGGVKKGMRVAMPEGPLLGEVTEVFRNQSKVELLSTTKKESNATLERGGLAVTLLGRGGGNFRMALPRDAEVEIGDIVWTSEAVPRILAEVVEVDKSPTDALKMVLLSGPVNIFGLRFVIVLP